MVTLSTRARLRSYYQRALQRKTREITIQELGKNAVLFAPHQDDETLGCGATLIKKREAGAQVAVVFMTDGRQSHASFLPADKIIPIRRAEAIEACQSLGIDPQAVHFLNYEDSRLSQRVVEAAPAVKDLLEEYNPAAVFIPYHGDVLPDHVATNQIVHSVLKTWGHRITVYEYPVWSWFHWPWVRIIQNNRQMTKVAIKNSLQFQAGLHLLKNFRISVNISSLIERKKTALDLYQSQMVRLNSNPQWPILSDVSNGEFLSCFFQTVEIFHRYDIAP